MEHNTNPSKRPSRWARLKEQARQARATAKTATNEREWAYLFITHNGLWREFNKWAIEQATECKTSTDTLCIYLAQAQEQAEQTQQRLTVAQMTAKMYEEQKSGYYEMIGTLNNQIDRLLKSVYVLTDKVISQREEIQALKRQADTPEADTLTD